MSNEEAIIGLKRVAKMFSGYKPNEEMFDMAIKALEQPTHEPQSNTLKSLDCIDRQDAIDELKTRRDSAKDWYDKASADGDEMIIARADSAMMSFIESILTVKKLPSVHPEQNTIDLFNLTEEERQQNQWYVQGYADAVRERKQCQEAISRQAAIDALRTCYDTEAVTYTNGNEYISYDQALDLIGELPSVQPEIIHCRDCKYWMPHTQLGFDEDNDEYHDYCKRLIPEDEYYAFRRDADEWCSRAERREEV